MIFLPSDRGHSPDAKVYFKRRANGGNAGLCPSLYKALNSYQQKIAIFTNAIYPFSPKKRP
jgi:hypothetical protein